MGGNPFGGIMNFLKGQPTLGAVDANSLGSATLMPSSPTTGPSFSLGSPQAAPQGSSGDIFSHLVNQTLGLEGGFSKVPGDSGGATMHGISWNNNQEALKALGYTPQTLSSLTPSDATKIYEGKYYTDPKINLLPNDLQPYVFDYGVHSGPQTAIKALQSTVGADPDGILGPQTLKAISGYVGQNGSEALKTRYLQQRSNYLQGLANKNPQDAKFLPGWLNRINYLKSTIPLNSPQSI